MSPQPTFSWSVDGGGTILSTGKFTAGSSPGGPFTVTAASGGVNGTASVTVTGLPADFSLSVTPASRTVSLGSSVDYAVTITPSNGFNGPVTLSVSGQPPNSTVTFTPNPATSTATVHVVAPSNGAKKAYTLTIRGVNGSLSHTTTVTLNVTK